jgi:signal transduction histidine kinase
MAERLEESRHSLEQSVQEARTATAMAREANRLKSEFLSTMSHELRTPLNAIIGFAEIILNGMAGPISEKQQHKIARIHLNSKRLLDLINDLLDLAKIEAGRVDLVAQPFSPRDLAMGVRAQMESLAEQRGLGFDVHVDPKLPAAMVGDVSRIEQVAKNLLSNAFKFTKTGRVEMTLHANGGRTWEITVVDTGIGIPPHALEYIFDEFRQVDGTSQRAYGGSGLGLSITRNLTRMMGGEVRVASTVGEGSTFTIVLPVMLPEPESMAVA